MLKLKQNLIALALFLMVVGGLVGVWSYRALQQANAATAIRDLGVDLVYSEPEHWLESYPKITDWLGRDFYANLDLVTVPKNWEGDVKALAPHLVRLPCLKRVVFNENEEALAQILQNELPGMEIEVSGPDFALPMAGGR